MRVVYDIKLRKVGCVLLQAAMGGDPEIAKRIPNEDWLINTTPDLRLYNITPEEVEQLVRMHNGLPRVSRNADTPDRHR
jgi:hypothetical protein